MQVILLALAGGLVVLSAVVVFMVLQVKPGGFAAGQGPQWNALPLLTVVLIGIGALNLLMAAFLPPVLLINQINLWAKSVEPVTARFEPWESTEATWIERVPVALQSGLLQRFQGNRIICAGLCESSGMLSAIAFLLEGHLASLIMMALSIVLLLWHVPTQASLSQWLFAQVERLQRN